MSYQLYYKTPDMPKGKNASAGIGFRSLTDITDFLRQAPSEMPENTLFYYREGPFGLAGKAWLVRDGRILEIWSPRTYRRYKLPMPQIMKAAPNMTTAEIEEMLH